MPKKLRFKIELIWLFILRNWVVVVFGIILGLTLPLVAKPGLKLLGSPRFQTTRIGLVAPVTLNKLPPEVKSLLSYGLTSVDETTQRIVPSPLVQNILLSDDRKKYTISLFPGKYWHNGKEITAYDIDYKIPGVTITPLNKYTLSLSVDTPYAGLLSLFTQPLIKNNTVGNGPYKLVSLQYQEGYIRKIRLTSLDPQKPALEYYFYLTDTDALTGLKLGEVETIKDIDDKSSLINWPNTEIISKINTNQYVAIFLNTTIFSNKKIRQALSYATPKFSTAKDRALGPLNPTSWAYNNDLKSYDYNPLRAKELWGGEELKKIQLLVNDRSLLDTATQIQKSWQDTFGITVDIQTRNENTNTSSFDALLAVSSIPLDPDQYTFWHSTQKITNITQLNFAPIDKLLEEGRTTFDLQERKKIYLEFQKILVEEAPAIFLFYPTQYSISKVK